MRRALCLLLSILCITAVMLTPASAVSVGNFTDVSSSAWYYDAVNYSVNEGLFTGTSSTTFSPNSNITRGMFITVLGRYAGVDASAWCTGTVTGSGVNLRSGPATSYSSVLTMSKGSGVTILGQSGSWYYVQYGNYKGYVYGSYLSPDYHHFTDVDYSQYYAGYAVWAYEKGIINGMGSSDLFAPNLNITREQICKILAGYADYAGISLSSSGSSVTFTDSSAISSWAISGVQKMQQAGIVQGEADGSGYKFRPGDYARRCEAAIMFQRLAQGGSGGSGGTVTPTATPVPATTPVPTAAPAANDTSSAAGILGSTISIPSKIVRVGLYVSTKSTNTSVQKVTLANTNGSSFEYGTFSSAREFISAGTISSATITITTSGSAFTVKDADGTTVYTTGGNLAIHPVGSSGKAITRVNGNYRFFGDFELRQAYGRSGYISIINFIDVEDYIKGVIPYEFSPSWPAETLKAAAVVARNFVMSYNRSVYSSFGFDIIGMGNAQSYYGRGSSYSESYFASTDSAVDATAGLYLTYASNGTRRLCETYYFSSDGGATEDSGHIWGTSLSYLTGKVDPYEAAASSQISNYEYSITLSRTGSKLKSLASTLGLGSTGIAPDGIRINTYPVTGNVSSITVTGTNGKTATISQNTSFTRWNFLSAVGFTAYSYRFSVTYNSNSDTFTITRHGWGHNIGLSQWGAYAMARYYNKSYQEILGFYYDGTSLQYGAE